MSSKTAARAATRVTAPDVAAALAKAHHLYGCYRMLRMWEPFKNCSDEEVRRLANSRIFDRVALALYDFWILLMQAEELKDDIVSKLLYDSFDPAHLINTGLYALSRIEHATVLLTAELAGLRARDKEHTAEMERLLARENM